MRSATAVESQVACAGLLAKIISSASLTNEAVPTCVSESVDQVLVKECSSKPHALHSILLTFIGQALPEAETQQVAEVATVAAAPAPEVPAVHHCGTTHCAGCPAFGSFHFRPEVAVSAPQTQFVSSAPVAQTVEHPFFMGGQQAGVVMPQQTDPSNAFFPGLVPAFMQKQQYESTPVFLSGAAQILGGNHIQGCTDVMPATLQEFLTAQFCCPSHIAEQELVRENLPLLKQKFIQQVTPFIHDICDVAYHVNEKAFYSFLKGTALSAEDLADVAATYKATKEDVIMRLAGEHLQTVVGTKPAAADELVDFDEDFLGEEVDSEWETVLA